MLLLLSDITPTTVDGCVFLSFGPEDIRELFSLAYLETDGANSAFFSFLLLQWGDAIDLSLPDQSHTVMHPVYV